MSFYGDIKRINSSPFVFDRYYSSRTEMDEHASSDNVYVGRYVLVKYTYNDVGKYWPIQLTKDQYEKNKYYIRQSDDSYILCDKNYVWDASYGGYIEKDEEGNSISDTPAKFFTYKFYFEKYDINRNAYIQVPVTEDIYQKNYYYIKNGSNFVLDNPTTQEGESGFNSETEYYVLSKSLSDESLEHAQLDLDNYQDTYDATVWQKVYTKITNESNIAKNVQEEKYILVAELNAAVPRLEFKTISPKYGENQVINGENKLVETWSKPAILPSASTEDAYTFLMPNVLHLDVGEMEDDFYGRSLIDNPAEKKIYDIDLSVPPVGSNYSDSQWAALSDEEKRHILVLSSEYNYMKWTNLQITNQDTGATAPADVPGDIDAKQLETKLYAFGQLISDLYDALYGAPVGGGAGLRPFYTENISEVLSNYDKGLIGILSSIATEAKGDIAQDLYGRQIQNGQYYYFISKWGDASEDPNNFIENIPEVIGAQAGGGGKAHYYIDFNNPVNGNYLKTFST